MQGILIFWGLVFVAALIYAHWSGSREAERFLRQPPKPRYGHPCSGWSEKLSYRRGSSWSYRSVEGQSPTCLKDRFDVRPEKWEKKYGGKHGDPLCPECVSHRETAREQRAQRKIERQQEERQREVRAELRRIARRRTHSHVRRARELQAPGEHSTAEWLLKLEEFGHRCAYCGTEGADFHRDHLVPLVDGGANSIGNIVPACPSCNLSKGGKSGAELLRWITERKAAGRTA